MIKELKGAILVISGPSGCGKSTLLKEIYKNIPNYYFSISTTTRALRGEEEDGVDYHFVSQEEFEKNIKDDKFLEYAKVHNNYYGTMLEPITKALNDGKLVIFDIDVQGHRILRKKLDKLITSVFITTPTLKIIVMKKIVVVGGNFAGSTAALELKRKMKDKVQDMPLNLLKILLEKMKFLLEESVAMKHNPKH